MDYQEHVKQIYINTRYSIQRDMWQLLHPKHFVNALLIRHIECSREREIINVITIMKHGLTSNKGNLGISDKANTLSLLETHAKAESAIQTNEISDIFQQFETKECIVTIPNFILIEGAPGMGKTTLCKEIAYQWAKQCLLKDTKLLLLIYLRDPSMSKIKNLKDLIHYFYSFDEGVIQYSQECAKILNDSDGNDLTIVFDGFDEFDSSSDSLIANILYREVLPQCRIVVTSRLTASNRLHRLADVRVQVLGFTDESKSQYIKQELKDHPNKIEALQSYLDKHESINSICYMPMMMTILVYIFKENKNLPNNSAELYDKFIAITISHHLQKQKRLKDLCVSLYALPSEHKSFLMDLSKFAFLTLHSKKKVFSKEDIENYCPNSTLAKFDLESFGLINIVHYFSTDKGHSNLFNFLHLSIHEYLAAYYLSSVDECIQFDELRNTFLNELYQETWKMFIFMNKKAWLIFQNFSVYCKAAYHEGLSNWIAQSHVKALSLSGCFFELHNFVDTNVAHNEIIQILFAKNDASYKSAKHIYMSFCSKKNVNNTRLDLFVIDKASNFATSLWFDILLTSNFSTAYCTDDIIILNQANQQQQVDCFKFKTSVIIIALIDCHISESTVDVMELSNLHCLHVMYCTFECNTLIRLATLISSISTLSNITLQGNKLSTEEVDAVSLLLNSHYLQTLDFEYNHLCYDILKLTKALEHTNTLKVINFTSNNIPHSATTAISNVIRLNTSLKEFYIGSNKLQSSISVILESLSEVSSLQKLELHDNEISVESSKMVASVVANNIKLQHLVLNNNSLGEGVMDIVVALQGLDSLQLLDLGNTSMPKEVSEGLALVIEYNCLHTLKLHENNLQSSAIVILRALSKISSLKVLDLQSNQLNEDTGEYLSSVICNNTGLQHLNLNNNNIGKGTLHIMKALQQLNSMEVLGLDNTNMPSDVSYELALVIKHNQYLNALHVNNNNLRSSAFVILQALSTISNLRILDLHSNRLNEYAGEYVSSVICNNTGLNELFLNDNNIGKGILQIIKALQHLNLLKVLNLGSINFPKEASNELALVLKNNQCLNALHLNDNNLQSSAVVILQALSEISSLRVLDLRSMQLHKDIGEFLSLVICENTRLNQILLSDNNIGKGLLHVIKALQQLDSLLALSLGNTNMPREFTNEFAIIIEHNPHLCALDLHENNLQSPAVVILEALSKISSLQILNLHSNHLNEDAADCILSIISHNTGLEGLFLHNNNFGKKGLCIAKSLQKFTSLNMLGIGSDKSPTDLSCDLGLVIQSNQGLNSLCLPCNVLNYNVFKPLSSIATLTTLNLINARLGEDAGEILSSIILHNIKLVHINLSYNNLGNGALHVIKAVQQLTQLEVLHLSNINLGEEVIKECGHALSCTIINSTQLAVLDLNMNNIEAIAIQVVKALQQINSLTELYLGNCNLPKEICDELQLVISCNEYLETLSLPNNNLCYSTVLILQALNKISTLKVLNLQGNEMTEEVSKLLASVILNNLNIEQLFLDNNYIGKGILIIVKALQQVNSLKVLSLGNVNMPKDVSGELALAIQCNRYLDTLHLNDNNLQSSAVFILQGLSKISSLNVLNLQSTQLTDEVGIYVSSAICENTELMELSLDNNNIGKGILDIIKALQQLNSLQVLGLGNTGMPQSITNEVALVIEHNQWLDTLHLYGNNLQSSAAAILLALGKITLLKEVDLNSNQLGEDAGKNISSLLYSNTGLESLFVHNNNIGKGVSHISKALQKMSSLKMLDLAYNNLTLEVTGELALAVQSNQGLKSLNLSCNRIGSNILITDITTLTELSLCKTHLTQEAGVILSTLILRNTKLIGINLSFNNLGSGAVQVIRALQHLKQLKALFLGNANLTTIVKKEWSEELACAIECNRYLEMLSLPNNDLQFLATVIFQSLSTISTLKFLDVQHNKLTKEAGKTIASVLHSNTRIEELNLDENNLGEGTFLVAKALQKITSLKSLNLGNNEIPKEVSGELALAILSNRHLKELRLHNNSLLFSLFILQSLRSVSQLTQLDLAGNEITLEAEGTLASVILHNTELQILNFHNHKSLMNIVLALQNTTNLKQLNLYTNNFTNKVANELALVIKSNKTFERLRLHGNNLCTSTTVILCMLKSISKLKYLDIFNNVITESAAHELANVLKNSELEVLHLNLVMAPIQVTEALQNITTLKSLVYDSSPISAEAEIKLALTITNNKLLQRLSLCNIHLSQTNVLQGIATISNLTTLWLEDTSLSEEMSVDLALAICSNSFLEILNLADNMLQMGLITIAKECSKLTYMKVLHFAHNCINPNKIVDVTSIFQKDSLLERIMLGGIALTAAETFNFNVSEIWSLSLLQDTNPNNLPPSIDPCKATELIYLELLRKQINTDTKCETNNFLYARVKNFCFLQKIQQYFKNSDITKIRANNAKQKLAQVDAKKIISSLHILESIKVIDLENNNIDEDASFELATALHSNNVLEQLWLRGNKLNTAGALYILNSLEYLTTLQVLDLSYNNIGSESADGIAAVIDNNPLMNQLWLDGNDLCSTGTIVICNALKKIRTLSILSLCNNGITDDAADELSAVITHNVLLEDLLLSNNQLQYTGITIIAESLSKLIKLRKLDLFNNNISRQGASSLAIVLQNSTSLQDLFLSGNYLETSGALEICNALSHINSLHVLTLSNNNISDEVTSQLIEVLNNNHLYALLIGGNGLECGALKIAQVIENDNIAMQLLDFFNNNISEQDREKIKVVFSKRENFQFYV